MTIVPARGGGRDFVVFGQPLVEPKWQAPEGGVQTPMGHLMTKVDHHLVPPSCEDVEHSSCFDEQRTAVGQLGKTLPGELAIALLVGEDMNVNAAIGRRKLELPLDRFAQCEKFLNQGISLRWGGGTFE
jgi:hypothetical protein